MSECILKERRKNETFTYQMENNIYCINDQIANVLIQLNYETEFVDAERIPLHRFLFAYPTVSTANQTKFFINSPLLMISPLYLMNPSDPISKHTYLYSLASWLLKLCGRDLSNIKWEDHVTMIESIYSVIVEINGSDVEDVNVETLKSCKGYGEAASKVILFLCMKALEKQKRGLKKPQYQTLIDDAAEMDVVVETDNEEEVEKKPLDWKKKGTHAKEREIVKELSHFFNNQERAPIEGKVDDFSWQLELQQVRHHLKKKNPNEKEFLISQNLHHVSSYLGFLKQNWAPISSKMEALTSEVQKSIDTIKNKEELMQQQATETVMGHGKIKLELNNIRSAIAERNKVVTRLEEMVLEEEEKLENLQMDYDEANALLVNPEPLNKVKNDIEVLKQDIKEIDVKSGILTNTLLQSQMKQDYSLN